MKTASIAIKRMRETGTSSWEGIERGTGSSGRTKRPGVEKGTKGMQGEIDEGQDGSRKQVHVGKGHKLDESRKQTK